MKKKVGGIRDWRLQTKLLTMIGIVMVIALAAQGYLYLTQRHILKINGIRQVRAEAEVLGNDLKMFLEGRVNDLATLARLDIIKLAVNIGGGQGGTDKFLTNMVKQYGYYEAMMVTDTNGKVLSASTKVALGKRLNRLPWWQSRLNGSVYLTDPTHYPFAKNNKASASSKWTCVLVSPISLNKKPAGYVVSFIKWSNLTDLVDKTNQVLEEQKGISYITGSHGKIFVHTSPGMVNKLAPDWVKGMLATKAKRVVEVKGDNGRHIAVCAPIPEIKGCQAPQLFSVVQLPEAALFSSLHNLLREGFIANGVIFVALLFLAFWLNRDVVAPVVETAGMLSRTAENMDLTSRLKIRSNDEIGHMASSVNGFLDSLQKTFKEVMKISATFANSTREVHKIAHLITGNAREQAERAGEVQRRVGLMGETASEVAMHAESSAKMAREAAQVIQEMANTSLKITQASAQNKEGAIGAGSTVAAMGETAKEVQARAIGQSKAAQRTADSLKLMADQLQKMATEAKGAAKQAKTAMDSAWEGRQAMDKTVKGMEAISESSEQVKDIVDLISDIAEQTNLLALNAAIEAARAGEHGRGFGVVAEEIRKLADRTTESTKEIANLIRESTENVKEGMSLAAKSAQALENLVNTVEESSNVTINISKISDEQAGAIQGLLSSTNELKELAGSIVEMTEKQASRRKEAENAIKHVVSLSEEIVSEANSSNLTTKTAVETVDKVVANSGEITARTSKQRERSSSLQKLMAQMSEIAIQNAKGAEKALSAMDDLLTKSQEVEKAMRRFKVSSFN